MDTPRTNEADFGAVWEVAKALMRLSKSCSDICTVGTRNGACVWSTWIDDDYAVDDRVVRVLFLLGHLRFSLWDEGLVAVFTRIYKSFLERIAPIALVTNAHDECVCRIILGDGHGPV